MSTLDQRHPTIVGGGMSGTLMALYLARNGFNVELYERRGDREGSDGRSFNITLSVRGTRVLEEIGLLDSVLKIAVPVTGRMIHAPDGTRTFQPYGRGGSEVLYSLTRADMFNILRQEVQKLPNVTFHHHQRCVGLDKQTGQITFQDELTGQRQVVPTDFIVGTDGAFSTVRQQMHRGERASYQQDFLDWGDKELTIPAGPGGTFQLEPNMLHVWPRNGCLLLAFPNYQGFFSCMCLLPFEGQVSFASLRAPADVRAFFEAQFSDVLALAPTIVDEFLRNPAASFVTTRSTPWYYQDRVVLVGDACHAVVPFYGQGLNAAFEDCSTLNACIRRHGGASEQAFAEYQALRKPHTDTLADLSQQNFIELRDKTQSPLLNARKKLDNTLHRFFPQSWLPLYTMIAHTCIPYADALRRAREQDRIARLLGIDLILLLLAGWEYVRNLRRVRGEHANSRISQRPARYAVAYDANAADRVRMDVAGVQARLLSQGAVHDDAPDAIAGTQAARLSGLPTDRA